jgi:hypothetical protein
MVVVSELEINGMGNDVLGVAIELGSLVLPRVRACSARNSGHRNGFLQSSLNRTVNRHLYCTSMFSHHCNWISVRGSGGVIIVFDAACVHNVTH